MPKGNRMGPAGMGPLTGRSAGFCAGYGMPGYMNPGPGYGFGVGSGWSRGFGGGGRGWRHWFHATRLPGWMRFGAYPSSGLSPMKPDPETEKQALKTQSEALQNELDLIRKRMDEIEGDATKE